MSLLKEIIQFLSFEKNGKQTADSSSNEQTRARFQCRNEAGGGHSALTIIQPEISIREPRNLEGLA